MEFGLCHLAKLCQKAVEVVKDMAEGLVGTINIIASTSIISITTIVTVNTSINY